jgi:hypothetical protein
MFLLSQGVRDATNRYLTTRAPGHRVPPAPTDTTALPAPTDTTHLHHTDIRGMTVTTTGSA